MQVMRIIGGMHLKKLSKRCEFIKSHTDKPLESISCSLSFADDIVDSLSRRVKWISLVQESGKYMDRFHEAGITVIPVVPSVA